MKRLLILGLSAIFLTVFFRQPSFLLLIYFLSVVILTILFDLLFLKIRRIPLFFPLSAIISGMIIGLLNDPNSSFFKILMITFLAIFSKHFLKFKNRPLFNPAAFGLFFGHLFFRQDVSWWAVSQSLLLIAFLPGYVSLIRLKSYKTIFSFLIVYWILNFFSFAKLFDPTVIFFSLVMLPEPMTSPHRFFPQIVFGIVVATLAMLFSLTTWSSDPLIFSLLTGNLIFFKLK